MPNCWQHADDDDEGEYKIDDVSRILDVTTENKRNLLTQSVLKVDHSIKSVKFIQIYFYSQNIV